MTDTKEIGIGVIGCGHWGPNHIRVFANAPGSRMVAAADPDELRTSQLSRLYKDVAFVPDYADVLANPEVEAVVIATPTETHYEIAKKALEAGKDVLCEKPLTLSYKEASSLADLAEENGLILMVGHIFLFNNGILELHRILSENKLGRTYYLHSVRTNLGPIRSDVNVVYDLASHDISIYNFLLGSSPSHVTATGMNYLQGSIEDVAFITAYYPSGVIANCHVSWLHPKKIRELTIVGDKKMASWDDLSQTGPVMIYSKHVDTEPYYSDFGHFNLLIKEGEINVPHVPMREPLQLQGNAFLDAIRTREKPLSDGRFGARVVAFCEAANRSIQTNGRPVNIES